MYYEKELTGRIIGAAIEVHRALGPGLLESAYQVCLAQELSLQGLIFEREKPLPVEYKGLQLDCGYRLDFIVADTAIPVLGTGVWQIWFYSFIGRRFTQRNADKSEKSAEISVNLRPGSENRNLPVSSRNKLRREASSDAGLGLAGVVRI